MAPTLKEMAERLLAPGKGILAADESIETMNKRLKEVGIEQDVKRRQEYRELLFSTPDIAEQVSGVILFDETIRQNAKSGMSFSHVLESKGIIPGIKVDKGKIPLPQFPHEEVTEGLDGLGARLAEYYELGARFAKWRAVIPVAKGVPTEEGLHANMHAMARYAALCQENHIVPIVEPEVLYDDPLGEYDDTHTVTESAAIIERTMRALFAELARYRVDLSGLILKTSMALSGVGAPQQAKKEEIARATVSALRATVPETVSGIVFLSGGQAPVFATENLQAIALLGPHPWKLTYSYARALQEPVLMAWQGSTANIPKAQAVFQKRLKLNALAREGKYDSSMESQ